MSLLSQITKGKMQTPDLLIIYGVDGVGKSSFAAAAPNPLFIGPEKGTANLDVARTPDITELAQVSGFLTELLEGAHDYKTLVIDSLDWLEPIVWQQVCRDANAATIEEAYGGYGKGYLAANKLWQNMMRRLGEIREKRKMNVIAIAHSQVKTFNDPQQNASYDRYQLKLNDRASALWREFVDCVLFANFEVYTKTDQQKKTRAYGEGVRLLHTERRPGFDAKNRYGLPTTLPLEWRAYVEAKQAGAPEDPQAVMANIEELMKSISDQELLGKVQVAFRAAGQDISKLLPIQNRLRTLLSQ